MSPPRPRTLELFAEAPPGAGPRTAGQSEVAEIPATGREFLNNAFDPGASDLSRTNELLEQLLAETRRRAVAYLPASGPGWNR